MAMVMNRETPTAGAAHAGTGAWIMRLCWAGGGLWGWLRLLAHGRCAIDRSYWLLAIAITLLSLYHTLLHLLQLVLYGRRITQTQIVNAPFFVIGHWRSGTTFLHDLLSLDERHAYPTTYQCVAQSFFGYRVSGAPRAEAPLAVAATDGQHGVWLGAAERRRVRFVPDGSTLAVSSDRFP